MPAKKKNEKPLTLADLNKSLTTHFIKFYDEMIEPNFRLMIKDEIQEFRNEANQRFDDLYKKFEDLRQEYLTVC